MALPPWRLRQLAAGEDEREQRATERLGVLFDLDTETDMPADVLNFPETPDDAGIEPDADELPIEIEPDAEPESEIEPEPEPAADLGDALVSTALVEILPPDFPLPILAKFVPNPALKVAAEEASRYALSVSVEGQEGLQRADLALTALRTTVKAIESHFEEPIAIANSLHKRLTGIRTEWTEEGQAAVKAVGSRVYAEQKRLNDLAAEERRVAQAEADRQVRENARLEAKAAEKAQAPAPVVEELKRQAETASAPPVAMPAAAPAPMRGSSTVTTWKARLTGTSGADDSNPAIDLLTPAQRETVLRLLTAIVAGKAPLNAIELNWKYLNQRAKSDKSALAITGIEAYEEGSVRAKSTRVRG